MTGAQPATPALRTTRVRVAAGVLLVVLALALGLDAGRVTPLREAWFDTLQAAWPRPVEALPAVVVAIDDRSLAELGRWPWPRTRVAELVDRIAALGPGAIGIDVVMPEADTLSPENVLAFVQGDAALRERIAALPRNDEVLARALRRAPSVLAMVAALQATAQPLRAAPILVADARGDAESATRARQRLLAYPAALSSLPALTQAAHGWGLISAEDVQGVVRAIPLVANVSDTLVPGLAVDMWRVAIGAHSLRVLTEASRARAVRVGGDAFRIDADGTARPWFSPHLPQRFVSAVDVLRGRVDPAMLQRTFALIGVTGLALGDYVWTPAGKMPGVEVHAQVLENMHGETFLHRPGAAPFGEAVVLLVAGGLLAAFVPRWRVSLGVALVAVLAAAAFAASLLAFRGQRLLIDAATPSLALALVFATLLALQLADAVRQRRALQRVLQQEREVAARVAGELEAARRIQLDTLPHADSVRDLRIGLAATMEPALEVGGDLYDFYLLGRDRLFFMLGDVAGKGLSASIFMAVSKALCKSTVLRATDGDLGEWLTQANREVARDNPGALFVTVFAGVLDLASGDLEFCNAGHENPWLRRAADGRVSRLAEGGGPPLCVLDDFDYRAAHVTLARGDLLCVVSDGVTEANDAAGAMYGAARVAQVLEGADSAASAVSRLLGDVKRFAGAAAQSDDISILAVRWAAPRIA